MVFKTGVMRCCHFFLIIIVFQCGIQASASSFGLDSGLYFGLGKQKNADLSIPPTSMLSAGAYVAPNYSVLSGVKLGPYLEYDRAMQITDPVAIGNMNLSGAPSLSGKKVGGYNNATRTYAGSEGSSVTCGEVLTALGLSQQAVFSSAASGMGCYYSIPFNYGWITNPGVPTNSSSSLPNTKRACACNN